MNKIDLDSEAIRKFWDYANKGKIACDDQRMYQLRTLLLNDGTEIASKNCIIRRLASIRGIGVYNLSEIALLSKRYLAFGDACFYLTQKKIPVFFYNRVGKKKGFTYSDSASKRMKSNKSFPCMYENIDENIQDFEELFGEKYSKEYVEDIGKIPQIVKVGNIFCHQDAKGKYVNVLDGKRITRFQPENSNRTIHIYGRCGVFGYAVEDEETLPSSIQRELIARGFSDFQVINHGLWGGDDSMIDHNFLMESQNMNEGDIVIFYRLHFENGVINWLEKKGLHYKDITDEWHGYSEAKWCFFDKPGHMNDKGYKIVSKIILDDLIYNRVLNTNCNKPANDGSEVYYLKQYWLDNMDADFDNELREYVESIANSNFFAIGKNNGAIVMNCNPFTHGHRYLIEYAAVRVDYLFIFVVEEDKSFFKFSDRFNMVVEGTKDIKNVIVIPSGRFIISSYTFPEYFMKDYVKEKEFDVSSDVKIFCKNIAPSLSIKTRFVGEEPFDPVTANYNECMNKIFPEYNMEFVEIPRKMLDEKRVINATEVRKLLAEKRYEEIKDYVPLTTYKILKDNYF